MADVLLSALMSSMVRTLNARALQEFGVAWGLSTELEKLESTLSTIQAVLQDAEEKQWKSEAIGNWLRKLKDGAYDADDVLDEFATEALRRKVEREKGVKSQVSIFFSLRNRLIFRMKMADKLKNVRDKLEAISMERSKFHLREGVINMEVLDIERRQTSSIVNESEIYGRGGEKEKIIEVLLTDVSNQDNLSIYAVWGMGGLGKTTLAQLVYNDVRVERHFEMRIWVCVSDDFHIRRLVGAIIESIDGNACSLSELDSQQQRLQEKLRGRRFLLVLDDVWNEYHDKWDGLKAALRCGAKGSMVILTTRIEKVALMMATLPIHHMGCLSEADSWSLFKGRAFGMGRVEENSELESIGKEIVKKCGGMPLAIKALGSLMSLKNRKSEWLFVKESEIWDLLEGENSILPALRLSYHHLPPYLKQCFAYCCVFPKDHALEMDTLIQLWLANGFIPSKGLINLHDVGRDIFNELVWRSFFQDVKEDVLGNVTCKMHDLMHDLAQFIMMLECSTVESGKEMKVPKRIRHLSFTVSSKVIPWTKDIYKVQSLRSCIQTTPDYYGHYKSLLPLLLKQKYLRVCDFRWAVKGVPSIINNLKHLRYLDMSSSRIKILPESTTCLLNLEVLKVDYCHDLLELPNGMKHMKNLTYLGLTDCDSLTRMPKEMGQLTCLRSLSLFIAGKDDGYQINELKGLNLRGALCLKELNNVTNLVDAKNANLIGKENLHSVSLVWRRKDTSNIPAHVEDVLNGLQPHSNLKKLRIERYGGSKFPTWMEDSLIQNLVEISLQLCERCEHLPPLGKLSFLKDLFIYAMTAVKYLGNEFYGDTVISFPSLERFELCFMANLEEWRTVHGREICPRLSTLKINYCPKLVELPFIPSITSLDMEGNNAMLIRSVMNLTSLSSFRFFEGFGDSTVLPDNLLQNHKMLTSLEIEGLRNHKSLRIGLENLSALKSLKLDSCYDLETLLGVQNLRSLEHLRMQECKSLMFFPKNVLLGLSSLRTLTIRNCEKFCTSLEGIQYLTTLQDLDILGCNELISLPESIQHLTALRSLRITGSVVLSSLPKQIGSLTSLSLLSIWFCPSLMSVPEELQNLTALKSLIIVACPNLERRCKKHSGEDWHKIAHIPNIEIDPGPFHSFRVQSRDSRGMLRKLKFC
ncbi:putative disease resistance protein RGA3 [Quercus robur]|uniref:putative disease resistance protein RGA3 n=1 Tax=Quercus robur TaxID=38942 RepID=UPI002161CCED|nr:putative disease resistance protein RGA3 [Quercus robur]XP_050263013.1 putative disease resistance protein RGA3 [Quercus robur]